MKALVTGASSGIGRDIARVLSSLGYEIYAAARRTDRLEELKKELKTPVHVISCDLSEKENCIKLYNDLKGENIDVLVNNAGFGIFGEFSKIPLEKELDMLATNVTALHILTKLFLCDFKERGKGYILNVGSSAGFTVGPLLSSYYASKAYVLRLTQAVYRELKKENSPVHISVLCPGPVRTEFDEVANVKFSLKGLNSMDVAKYAVKKMFENKCVIIPGFAIKASVAATKLLPDNFVSKITYHIQHKKQG